MEVPIALDCRKSSTYHRGVERREQSLPLLRDAIVLVQEHSILKRKD